MLRKKKATNKQNGKVVRRAPLLTIPSFNFTEEIRIPTLGSNELKSMMRSVELRRSNPPLLANNSKKAVSRKSASKSVKLNPGFRPPKLKNIMRQFKELKLIHEAERSHSKSPLSCKSKSTGKNYPKRLSYPTLRTNPNSECNLTLKLQRTIKKLNETDFFKDEESLVPLASTSEAFEVQNEPEIISTDREQEIDMKEVRKFCSTGGQSGKVGVVLTINSYGSFKERAAAGKIQRAWRQYQTRKIVERYASFQPDVQFNLNLSQFQTQNGESSRVSEKAREEIVIPSEDFYQEGIREEKVRKISSLEQEESSGRSENYEQLLRQMKMQQLQKWNDLITIISQTKSSDPQEVQQLFQRIAQKSEENKKDLLAMRGQQGTPHHKKRPVQLAQDELSRAGKRQAECQQDKRVAEQTEQIKEEQVVQQIKNEEATPVVRPQQDQEQPRPTKHFLSESQPSYIEYDSHKYIDYLDGDMFPEGDRSSNSSRGHENEAFRRTISRRKQELLLNEMKMVNLPIKLGQSELYRSDSFKSLRHQQEVGQSRSRQGLSKSISQKVLRRTLQNISGNSGEMSEEEINLDLLTREFLEGTDPSAQNLDMVYGEEKLRSKLAELNELKNGNFGEREEEQEHLRNYQQRFQMTEEQRPQPAFELHRRDDDQIRVEEGSPEVRTGSPEVREEEANIEQIIDSSSSERADLDEEVSKRREDLMGMVLNFLVLEMLKQVSNSDKLSMDFNAYKLSARPKVRKMQAANAKKKKGFPTDKKEIDYFLDSIIAYLSREEPFIFKNLQVPTGPSALQMLKYMHQASDQSLSVAQQQEESIVMVIPNRVFEKFWQLKERSIVVQVPESFDQSNAVVFKQNFQYLKSFNKIFYRSLFDTLNECLDYERNFGQHGKPFPWKRAASFDHRKSQEDIRGCIARARKRMTDFCTTYCGLIIERDEMNGLQANEEYIQSVQQERLSRMLAADLLQSEPRWMFYDDEETEILIEVTNVLYAQILIELIQDLHYLM